MMVKCTVVGCRNRSDDLTSIINEISYHRIPKEENLRQQYCNILELDIGSILPGSRVCSAHFSEESLIKKNKNSYLKPGALPIAPTEVDYEAGLFLIDDSLLEQDFSDNNVPRVKCERLMEDREITALPFDFPQGTLLATPQATTSVDRSTQVSPVFYYNSPEKTRLRERLSYEQKEHSKKLKAVNRVVRTQNAKLTKLREALDDVIKRKVITADEAEELSLLGTSVSPDEKGGVSGGESPELVIDEHQKDK